MLLRNMVRMMAGKVFKNLVQNSNFKTGMSGWYGGNGNISGANSIGTITGNGTAAYAYLQQAIPTSNVVGKKTYCRVTFRTTKANCLVLRSYLLTPTRRDFYSVNNPIQNQWYTVSGIISTPTGDTSGTLMIYEGYADAVSANGSVMEVKDVLFVDLTELFGAGFEPTQKWCDINLPFTSEGAPILANAYKPINELSYNPITWDGWTKSSGIVGDNTGVTITCDGTAMKNLNNITNLKSNTKYAVLLNVISNTLTTYYGLGSYSGYIVDGDKSLCPAGVIGNRKTIFTTAAITQNLFNTYVGTNTSGNKIKIKDFRLFELPVGSQIEADFINLTADQLNAKYPF